MDQMVSSSGESVKVFVRVRPPDPNLESDVGHGMCLDVTSESTLMVYSKPDPKIFTFDHVANRDTTQEDVFSSIGRPIIDSCMHGYNGTIFAYGQTGSGKTFTMIGPPSEDSVDNFTHELRGIIPRSFEYLFSFINRNKQKYGELVEFLCKCSFLEIYNEQVFDLLDPASVGLHLRENMKHGVYVDGLTEVSVTSARDSYQVLSTGWVNRKVASTSMNRESSRSHAVFTLSIESKKREVKDSVAKIRTSVLNLVDLAGSERQRDTHAAGLRLKEAGSINKSLSALGNVIMALVDIANGKSRHVHYRDSKLTFLLRDSLGGNAMTNLVANVHPSARCFGESLSTLNFARRAKMIRNKAIINEDSSGNVLQLQAEIKRLRNFIERCKAGSPTGLNNNSFLSPPSPISSDAKVDDSKSMTELKSMLTLSMEARDKADVEKIDMCNQVGRLKELNERKDKCLQSTKMILKFRESHISNLEKARKTETPVDSESAQEENNALLREEIQQLKYLMEHHPERIKLIHENQELKDKVKKLHSSTGVKGESSQLARSHQYTLQLERQLRHYLARGTMNGTSPMAGCLAPNTPTKMTFDLEGLQARCKQLQEELDAARLSLNREREESYLRVSIVEASLTASKKANVELERSIEALKLKNNVEKATLNDIHMTTIKMILTPKRDKNQLIRNKSYSCTPSSVTRRDSVPFLHHQLNLHHSIDAMSPASNFSVILEDENKNQHLKMAGKGGSLDNTPDTTPNYTNDSSPNNPGSSPRAKKARLSKTAALSSSSDDALMSAKPIFSLNDEGDQGLSVVVDMALEEGETEQLDETQIQGALTEELKRSQDRNRSLQQEQEALEASIVHLSHTKTTLESKMEELTQLSRFEREGYYEKEQGYLEKVADIASQIAHLKSTNGVMESEVQDLRICLKSADKELKEVKEEKRDEKRIHDGKLSAYIQKINELESLYSTEESKYNRAVEELQNLQDEAETLREEMTFKEHHVCKLEDALRREKAQVSSQDGEIQNLLDKLAHEVEATTRLSLELQEGHNGKEELVATLNENQRLSAEVDQLEGELQSHLQAHKKQMVETELSLNTLLKQKSTDEAAISGFVATIQELRGEKNSDKCRLLDLEREMEDLGKELSAAVAMNDILRGEVQSLQAELREKTTAHDRELSKKEAENEIVCDDLDRLNDQYQQLNMEFEEQGRKLTKTSGDLEETRRELGSSEGEVKRLLHKKMDRSSLSKRMSSDEEISEVGSEEEVEQLKWQLDQAAEMIQSYETSREEKNSEILRLKDHVLALEGLEQKQDSQKEIIIELHYELSQRKEEENTLKSQCQASAAEMERMMEETRSMAVEKARVLSENIELRVKCGRQTEQVTALTEQIERYKTSEESLFQEKESVRSQLEMLHEEKAKLSKECEKLVKENAAITGHQNIRQKIQYHAAVKMENKKLKEEVIQLHSRLKWKAEQVDKLQIILTENGLEKHSTTKRTTHNDPTQVNFKGNVMS